MIMKLAQLDYPIIVAHRGFRSRYPENTLSAFSAAVDHGISMIELDVALTRDRQVIVIHDDTLDRTTTGQGPVNHMTLSDICQLDAGSWFGSQFSTEKIPTLKQVFQKLGGRCVINVEIKSIAVEYDDPADAIEKQILRMIHEYQLQEMTLISSFNPYVLSRLNQIDGTVPVALLSDHELNDDTLYILGDLKAFSWNPDYRRLNRDQTKQVQKMGIKVLPYTVNGSGAIQQVLDMGADGVITDDPVEAVERVKKRIFKG
jgi:glycerophosphoryl diester phosphodiesterase